MNKIYKLLMLFGAVALMSACNEDPEYYTLEDQPDEMHVKVTFGQGGDVANNLIKLSGTYINDEALHLSWNAIPSTDSVSYLVRFYATDNKKENYTDYYEVGSATEFSITHNELNSIVAKWALPGDELPVSAEVIGTVHNELKYIKPEVSTCDFNAIGWEKYPTNLYLHMTDMEGNTSVTELSQAQLGTGVYSAQLAFKPCTYYFTKTSYAEYPAYYADSEGKLLYVEDEGEYETFKNTETGTFTIIVDVNDKYLDSRVLNIQLPSGSKPYMVGDGTDIGWNTSVSAGYMTASDDPRTPYIYTWTGQFYAQGEFPDNTSSEGTFKILLADSYSGNCFFAPENNANPAENHELKAARTQGSQDYKWLVPTTGKYTFTINVLDMTTSFESAQ